MADPSRYDWKKNSQSFDTVADLYDEYRPGYPQEAVDSIVAFAGLADSARLLEIGSGTGKATLLFSRKGYAIHCIEPGANLSLVAARNLQAFPAVTFESARFEEWDEKKTGFDLAFSAQAFHWIPKEIGYSKAARVLKPGGTLALFWNMYPGFAEPIASELDKIYKEVAPELVGPIGATEEVIQERVAEFQQSGCFGPVTVMRFSWSASYSTGEYLGLLNTYSDHLRLPEKTFRDLCNRISAVIEGHGGRIERPYLTVSYLAKKAE